MLRHRGQASRFVGEQLQEPSASNHGVSDRRAILDSGKAVLYSQYYLTTRGLNGGLIYPQKLN
jgi:hypothetical protein